MITQGLLILGTLLILEGLGLPSLVVIVAGGIALGLALLWSIVEVITPLR